MANGLLIPAEKVAHQVADFAFEQIAGFRSERADTTLHPVVNERLKTAGQRSRQLLLQDIENGHDRFLGSSGLKPDRSETI